MIRTLIALPVEPTAREKDTPHSVLHLFYFFAFLCTFSSACQGNAQPKATSAPEIISSYKVLRIPVTLYSGQTINTTPQNLTIYMGGEDELAEGPTSFDVMNNGDIIISDPLLKRVVLYDSTGKYMKEMVVGIPVARIKSLDGQHKWKCQSATNDSFYLLESTALSPGFNLSPDLNGFEVDPKKPVLVDERTAMVIQETAQDTIHIIFDREESLISVEHIDSDSAGNSVIGLESALNADSVIVHRTIQKYDDQHHLTAQINDINVNLLVFPIDQFRYHRGRFYHLQPLENIVLIELWNF